MENKTEKEEIEIKQNTNIEVLQSTFESYGFELESVKFKGEKMFAVFAKAERK